MTPGPADAADAPPPSAPAADGGPFDRARANLTALASVLVTGIWLAALFTGQGWWLAFMLFGYIVLVPVVALLFGDEEDRGTWWNDDSSGAPSRAENSGDANDEVRRDGADAGPTSRDEALSTLRARYARGELTDEQFERKLSRLVETGTLEDVEDRARRRATDPDVEAASRSGGSR